MKQIKYKAKEDGIKTVLIDESFTSGMKSSKDKTVSKKNYTHRTRKHIGKLIMLSYDSNLPEKSPTLVGG